MKTKVYSILILLLLVVPIISTYTFLHLEKQKLRKEIKHNILKNIDKEKLILLSFKKTELQKIKWKHSSEFEFEGQMYDVVSRENKGSKTEFWCWNDSKETIINNKIDKLLAFAFGNDKQSNETQKRLSNFFNSLFLCETTPLNFANTFNEYRFNIYNPLFQFLILSPRTPPPELA